MMRKLMHTTVAAASLAALLSVGCATNDGLGDTTDVSDQVVQVRPEESGQDATVYPAPGPAKVDSDGNVYASSAAPGSGNAASVGTNTNVNVIPERSRVDVRETTTMTSSTTLVDTTPVVVQNEPVVVENESFVDDTATIETMQTTIVPATPRGTATIRTEATNVPMTSSVQESTTTTTTEETPARTRMRKD